MKKNTIILTQAQLIELITESVQKIHAKHQITEQSMADFRDLNMMYPNVPVDIQQGYQEYKKADMGTASCPTGGAMTAIHIIIDLVSVIAYLVCGVTYGAGCVISVVADLLNAYLYIECDEDYYMAGMQMAFSIVPGGEALKWGLKGLRPVLGPFFKTLWKAGAGASKKQLIKIAKGVRQNMTPAQLKAARLMFPKHKLMMAKKTFEAAQAAVTPYFNKIVGLETLWGTIAVMMRGMIIFMEMIWYDPEFTGQILKMAGSWSGIETLENWGNAMKDWNKWGVKVANTIYDSTGIGGIKALVQTSIADCNNTVYTWEYVKEQWMTENNQDFFDEDEMEAAWWNGWRPAPDIAGGKSGGRDLPASGDTAGWEALAEKNAMYAQYAAMKSCKKMTEGATYGPWLTSCSKFESMYNALNDEEKFTMLLAFITAKEEKEC